jgi:hypothetical protein
MIDFFNIIHRPNCYLKRRFRDCTCLLPQVKGPLSWGRKEGVAVPIGPSRVSFLSNDGNELSFRNVVLN